MKLAIISPYALAVYGGVQGQVAGLAQALQRRGHEVAVLAPGATGPVAASLQACGVAVVNLGPVIDIAANGSVAPLCLDPRSAWRARSWCVAHAVEVVHVHEPLAPLASYALIAAPTCPLVATYHRSGGGAGFSLLQPLRGLLANRFQVSVAVSHAAADLARRVTSAPVEVLFNGADLHRFTVVSPIPVHGPTICFIGRHEHRKGLEVLLEAHARLEGVTLWIGGEGPLTSSLKERFPESETRQWLGILDDDARAARQMGAAVVCAPSLGGESFGMVVLEALAAGSIAVVSDLEGYREALGGHGLLVEPGKVDALTEALRRALDDHARGDGLASLSAMDAARAHASSWSLDLLAERYDERYATAVERAKRDRGT